MRIPIYDMNIFRERRQSLAEHLKGSALILASTAEAIRNHDVHFPHRQDSNLFYLTGFEEPDSILIFRPGQSPETVMFVRNRDKERETWDGFRYGPEGVVRHFGIEAAYPIDQFEDIAAELLTSVHSVHYSLFHDRRFDRRFSQAMLKAKSKWRRSGRGNLPIHDSHPLLGEMRVIKSNCEIAAMKRACQVTSDAHVALMRATQAGVTERALHGLFIAEALKGGAAREGYTGIVAGGANATTLHYIFNDQVLRGGDLLLVDAGAEVDFYTGDVTRTYPVSGKFSPTQRRIYGRVLDLQKNLIKMVRPGLQHKKLQEFAVEGLTDIMILEGLMRGDRSELIKSLAYKKYYPHGVSHFLGLDVHDAGLLELDGQPRALEAGMVLTIEPGIYIPIDDDTAPVELRGIGIRIEDNVLVTASGHDVLTASCPKEIDDLEKVVGSGKSS